MKPVILFIVGPTASGKSKIALELARNLEGEILSADSMQIYRGMDIGTAKPSRREQQTVPHHLINTISPSRSFSAFDYRELALQKIREISERDKVPIVVGGSGLYVRALLQGFSGQPGRSVEYRKSLAREVKQKGLSVLYQRLQKIDPATAGKINPRDQKRIIRALEIHKLSGKKVSEWHGEREKLCELGYKPLVIGIVKDRQVLYGEINTRVDQMFRKGLVREVRELSKWKFSKTAAQAVGYKELRIALGGKMSLEKARELIKRNTRRLAKRQMTWFKREPGIEWVSWLKGEDASNMAEKIAAKVTNHAAR